MGKLTLEKVAQLSGVSRSTVSRVINNQPSVKPQVRQRVQQVIKETGYHPDPAARSLASRRSGIISLIIPETIQFLFTDPFFPSLIQGISHACNIHQHLFSLFLFQSPEEEAKFYPKINQTQIFDGAIITAAGLSDIFLDQLIQNKTPFVLIGRPTHTPTLNFVDVDHLQGAYQAVWHLLKLGYQRIATVTGPLNTTAGVDRHQGYLNALAAFAQPVDSSLIANGDYTEISGYIATQQILLQQPDAVFVASDTMALGSLRAIQDAGLTVPGDIAVVGFDDLPPSTISTPPLTTVRQPIKAVGAQAVQILLDRLNNPLAQPQQVVLPTELVIRESCGGQQAGLVE